MFDDKRSKSVVFVAHCILNQNSISDGTATHSGMVNTIVDMFQQSAVGIVQMPCPELHCLGLDRGDLKGGFRPLLEENTRIRQKMADDSAQQKLKILVEQILYQISEYDKHGFEVKGIIGINRSPSCGVETTSDNNMEIKGNGVLISRLKRGLANVEQNIEYIGIKTSEPELALNKVKKILLD